MSERVDISVVIPVYNAEDYLRGALNSVMAQEGVSIEVVAINDGSPDSSLNILEEYAAQDTRLRVISTPNRGYGYAMNLGMTEAKGKYMAILEPDDWFHEGALQKLFELAEKTGAPVAKGDYYIEVGGNSQANGKFDNLEEGAVYYPECLPECLAGAVSIWSAIYRLDWLREKEIRFSETDGASYQDLGFGIRTWAAAHQIAITKEAVYHYREDNPKSSIRRRHDGAWASLNELKLQHEVFQSLATSSPALRGILVKRIFLTLRADYLRRCEKADYSLLKEYSKLLGSYFPWGSFDLHSFSKAEQHDLRLIYTRPVRFPLNVKSAANWLQKIFSIRYEAGKRVLRIFGFCFRFK